MSLSGSEGVLAIAADLLRAPKLLPPDVAIVCMPWASPDGLTAQLSWIRGEGQCTLGRNGLPVDDDLDDAIDEDGPDDVDGDGRVVSMLVEDENGLWRRMCEYLGAATDDRQSSGAAKSGGCWDDRAFFMTLQNIFN